MRLKIGAVPKQAGSHHDILLPTLMREDQTDHCTLAMFTTTEIKTNLKYWIFSDLKMCDRGSNRMEKVDSVCSVTSVCSVQSLDDSFDVVPEETKFQLNVDGEKVRYKLKKDKSLPYSPPYLEVLELSG